MIHSQRAPCRILIVEDHADTAHSYEMLCRSWGHESRTAADAQQAIRLFNAFSPDLALIDVHLPDMSGYELARSIRANPAHARTILVAVTGNTSDTSRVAAFRAGFNEFVAKPVASDKLQGIVNDLCKLAA